MPAGVSADVKTYQLYINGEWVQGNSEKMFPVYDPASEEVIAQAQDANSQDVDRAVAAAKAAFGEGSWATTTPQERGRVLFRLAEKIRQNLPTLAELECRNTGKPIVEAEFDINDVATCFEYYGGLATKILGYVNPVPDNAVSLTLKEPVGVAGQIIPWNYPLLMAAWKLAPALAAGCTCVLKPAEQTPLTALEMANWFSEHCYWIRRDLWRTTGQASRREQDCIHRQCRSRKDHRQASRGNRKARNARTRRQVSKYFLRRCRFRSRN